MLSVSTAIRQQLNNYETLLYTTMEMDFPAPVRITDNPWDVVFESNTYSADGGLLSFSLPKADSVITRDLFTVTVADNDKLFRDRLVANPTGVKLTFRVHAVNPTTNADIGAFIAYSGRLTHSTVAVTDESLTARMEYAGELFKLDATNERLTNDDSQQNITSTDTCFSQVAAEIGELTLLWGRE